MVSAKVWQLGRRPRGEPTQEDFTMVDENLPPLDHGDVIVAAECLSVDPYIRSLMNDLPLNTTIIGEQVARVIESKNPSWPVGSYLLASVGWRTKTHLTSAKLSDTTTIQRLPDLQGLNKSLGLGVLGMTGNTAYLALMEVMRPIAGETVLVSGAAGAVGSAVVQLAKLAGCKVIGFAGSEDKVSWVKELGADHVFNYKTTKITEALAKAAPEGINIYFDNVGGKFSGDAMCHMAVKGRVLVCGNISNYNEEAVNNMESPYSGSLIIWRELCIQGFVIYNYRHRWEHSFKQMKKWVAEGKIKYKEHVVQGFNTMPDAFIGLFRGANFGKAVVMP